MLRSHQPAFRRILHGSVRPILLLVAVFLACSGLFAQNYSWDARSIGMGGETGLGDGNLATTMVPRDRDYSSVVVPLGFMQVLSNLKVFDPNDPQFDALRAIDYIGNPFHYSFNRDSKSGSTDFIKNIVDSGFNRDLNAYRGFKPPERLVAGGLLAPNWGHTFKVYKGPNQSFQGFYVGAGPYISLQTDVHFDPKLISILSSPVNVAVPANTTLTATNNALEQAAVAITGGYRAKFAFPPSHSVRDGLYVALNLNYLYGLRADTADLNLRILTDAAGLVAISPANLVPLTINHMNSNHGRGFSADAGFEVISHGWEFGFGADGIANRINWSNNHLKQFTMANLFTGASLVGTTLAAPTGVIRRELPVQYSGNVGYSAGRWTLRTDSNYSLSKFSSHAGAEYRLGMVALRGGTRYGLKKWNPTGGFGLNLTRGFGVDVGFFGNTTNLEQKRNLSMAVSLRFEHNVEK